MTPRWWIGYWRCGQSTAHTVCHRLDLAIQNFSTSSIFTSSVTLDWNVQGHALCIGEISCDMCVVVWPFYVELKEWTEIVLGCMRRETLLHLVLASPKSLPMHPYPENWRQHIKGRTRTVIYSLAQRSKMEGSVGSISYVQRAKGRGFVYAHGNQL